MTEKQLMKCGDGLAEWVEKSVGEGVKADDVIGALDKVSIAELGSGDADDASTQDSEE